MVYNDLNESNYTFTYDHLVFYFSSQFYQKKFIHVYQQFLSDEIIKLKLKFKCNICYADMILLLLYKKIEKRGFKVLYKGKELSENYCINININEISYKG